jgi:hypothetical protein
LRKKKTHEIISAKRRRMAGMYHDEPLPGNEHVQASYKGFQRFETNMEEYNRMLSVLCPQAIQDRSLTIVSILQIMDCACVNNISRAISC